MDLSGVSNKWWMVKAIDCHSAKKTPGHKVGGLVHLQALKGWKMTFYSNTQSHDWQEIKPFSSAF